MPANTYGRQVVIPLTNKSGGSVAAGDVVVFDTTADESFTTTTTGQAELSVGVAQETIANNALGRVLVSGYAALINVPSSRTRGQYIETHTVAKQATGSATRRAGSFGQFAKTSATPSGWLWGSTDQTASGGGSSATGAMNQLAANVTMTNANQYYDGPSLSLLAGTYVLVGVVTIDNQTGGGNRITIKVWDGTTVGASSQKTNTAAGNVTAHTVTAYVVVGSTTTWKVSAAGNGAGNVMLAAANTNGAGNNACTLVALKIA